MHTRNTAVQSGTAVAATHHDASSCQPASTARMRTRCALTSAAPYPDRVGAARKMSKGVGNIRKAKEALTAQSESQPRRSACDGRKRWCRVRTGLGPDRSAWYHRRPQGRSHDTPVFVGGIPRLTHSDRSSSVPTTLLWRDGRLVPLTPRALDILLLLIEHRGEVVDKDTLLSAIWGSTVVEEATVVRHVSTLRKALHLRPEEHDVLVTLPGRGYRFVAAVAEVEHLPAALPTGPAPAPAAARIHAGRRTRRRRCAGGGVQPRGGWQRAACGGCGRRCRRRRGIRRSDDRGTGHAAPRLARTPPSRGNCGSSRSNQACPGTRPGRATDAIAFTSDRAGNPDIWVQGVGDAHPIRLTSAPEPDWQPDWSPDGDSLVFRSERDGGGLYVVPAGGGERAEDNRLRLSAALVVRRPRDPVRQQPPPDVGQAPPLRDPPARRRPRAPSSAKLTDTFSSYLGGVAPGRATDFDLGPARWHLDVPDQPCRRRAAAGLGDSGGGAPLAGRRAGHAGAVRLVAGRPLPLLRGHIRNVRQPVARADRSRLAGVDRDAGTPDHECRAPVRHCAVAGRSPGVHQPGRADQAMVVSVGTAGIDRRPTAASR